jgi:PadR family transcriptional regulator PadR
MGGSDMIDENSKCSCLGYNLDKLIQPNILILLAKKKLHGYSIVKELEKKDLFKGESPDNTGVYRALKKLEENGFVQFEWDTEGTGPAKKIFTITKQGRSCLSNWGVTLENYCTMINQIIDDIKNI